MNEVQALSLLSTFGNESLVRHWNSLNTQQKHRLIVQLQKIDIPTLQLQQQLLSEPPSILGPISPFNENSKSGNLEDRLMGKELISKGLVGCLIVAGGQGSRLHIDGPKGVCEVTKIQKKSLFQLFAEKTAAAGKQAGRSLSLAIMTSPLNHKETIAYFRKNAFFGLNEKQIHFFQQNTLPLLNSQGDLFLETSDQISVGPDGNGGALQGFFDSGIWQDWYAQGIRYLNFVLIDNPLSDPFDAELIGFHHRCQSDVVIKCIQRSDPNEKVGVIVRKEEKASVVEYTEMPMEERLALNSDKNLLYPLANLSLFSFSMEFVRQAAAVKPILHKTFKAVKYLDDNGYTVNPEEPMAWKFERFIFDLLPIALKVDALVYPREVCFAPLKNFSGNDSYKSVADAIETRDRQILAGITGRKWNVSPLEISQEFYYPMPELLVKWRNREGHSGYIVP